MSEIMCNECRYERECFAPLKLAQKFKNICRQSRKKNVPQMKLKVE